MTSYKKLFDERGITIKQLEERLRGKEQTISIIYNCLLKAVEKKGEGKQA